MSVIVKGMEMPKRCADCAFKRDDHLPTACIFRRWYSLSVNDTPKTSDWCPLIEIPDGHGRLIDADALMKEFEKAENTMAEHGQEYSCSFMSSSQEISTEWYVVEEMVDNSPTVIPSDKEEVKE